MGRLFTVRWAASLAGCAILFGILWLGVGLGCDENCSGPRDRYPYTVVERR